MQNPNLKTSWSEVKKARVTAAHRERRLIFNDDGYELDREDADTADRFLERRLKPLAGTHVGNIAYSVIEGDAPMYDSKIQPIYGDAHSDPQPYWANINRNIKALIKGGHCPLQIIVDFAHENGMEAFASVRMNDVHDCFIPGWLATWKKQHPELMVDPKGVLPELELYITSQDFSHEEVRRRKLEIIEEICERYDIDGFEFDYIRHPVFFSRTMRGLPVSDDEVEIMTAFMRRIRQITDEAGNRRGRPVLLGARVPDTFELSKNVGLDIKRWMEEDLIDILIPGGGYAPFTIAVEEFTQVARGHGVTIYPCINEGAAEEVSEGEFTECVRALAANWYEAGADGVYLWNFGTPIEYKTGDELVSIRDKIYASLAEIGDQKALAGKDKLFCVDNGGGNVFSYYIHVTNIPPLPFTSKQGPNKMGVTGRVPLEVDSDAIEAAKSGLLSQMKLVVKLRGPVEKKDLTLHLNGEMLTEEEYHHHDDEGAELSFRVNAPPLRKGKNFIEVALKNPPAETIELYSMKLKVEYK